jgi:hypothetical protein
MSPSDQDDILHPVNSQFKLSGPREPAVDMLNYPLPNLVRYRVLPLGLYMEGIVLRLLSSGTKKRLRLLFWSEKT